MTRITDDVSHARTLLIKHPDDNVVLQVTKQELIDDAISTLETLLSMAGSKDRWQIEINE